MNLFPTWVAFRWPVLFRLKLTGLSREIQDDDPFDNNDYDDDDDDDDTDDNDEEGGRESECVLTWRDQSSAG